MGKNTDISKLIALQLAESRLGSGSVVAPTANQQRWYARVWTKKKWLALAGVLMVGLLWLPATWLTHQPGASGLTPDVALVLADDDRIETLSSHDKPAAIRIARKTLGATIARLGVEHPERTQQLRRRLIGRLLQSPEPRFIEAERQIVLLNETPAAPQAISWLAFALVGQINQATYRERDSNKYRQVHSYWNWLAHQRPGDVLLLALDHQPSDVRLVASLVGLAEHRPELFDSATEPIAKRQVPLRQEVRDRVVALAHDDSSHSLLVQCQFHETRNNEQACEVLRQGADAAEKRLLLRKNQAADHDFGDLQQAPLASKRPANYWDFVLLVKVAKGLHMVNPELAKHYYQFLQEVRLECVPTSVVERVYFLSGQLAHQQGHAAGALHAWRSGIERANCDSLLLFGAIATLMLDDETQLTGDDASDANDVLRQYHDAIQANSELLANAVPKELTTVARRQLGRQIGAARWRARVLESRLLFESDARGDAIERLRSSLTQSVDVDAIEQQRACVQLAHWYLAEGAADNAATYFERAIGLTPGDFQLREQAAIAWATAGNRSRAAEHWRKLSESDDLILKVSGLESTFQRAIAYQGVEPDLDRVRRRTRVLRQHFDSRRSNYERPADLRLASSRLEIVEASLPPAGTPFELHLESPEFQAEIASIAQEYRDDERVQRFAAEYLATAGDVAGSERALAALEKLVGATSTEVVIARARMLAAIETPIAAAKKALFHVGQNDAETRRALLHAVSWAMQANDLELAYQALARIPSSCRTCHDLFAMAKLVTRLPTDSEIFIRRDTTASELASRLRIDLRRREGGSCGFEKYLEASALIEQLSARHDVVPLDDPQLSQAQRFMRDLISRRPSWAEATVLAAELAVVEGNQRQAVRLLRDAVLAGDDHPHVHQRLRELQASTLHNTNQWVHLASSKRITDVMSPHAREAKGARKLLVAHQFMTVSRTDVLSRFVSDPRPAPTYRF